jgi:hypothetical protein
VCVTVRVGVSVCINVLYEFLKEINYTILQVNEICVFILGICDTVTVCLSICPSFLKFLNP